MEKADSKPIKPSASTLRLEAPQATKEFADLMAATKKECTGDLANLNRGKNPLIKMSFKLGDKWMDTLRTRVHLQRAQVQTVGVYQVQGSVNCPEPGPCCSTVWAKHLGWSLIKMSKVRVAPFLFL
jgi:hypothetical protein